MKYVMAMYLVLYTSAAFGFSIDLHQQHVRKWPSSTVGFFLDEDGTKDISNNEDLNAVRRAMRSWNNVACSTFNLVEAGTTKDTDTILTTGRGDGENRFVWIEDNRWMHGKYVLGVTTPLFNSRGAIEEADISFNGFATTWSVDGSATDVESVAVHEIGHLLGLEHVIGGENMSDPPTMAPYVDPHLKTRDLTDDDRAGACFLYPQTPYRCASNNDCPFVVDTNEQGEEYYASQLTCNAGTCDSPSMITPGTHRLGETCASDKECADNLFCQSTSRGSFCAHPCVGAALTCPDSFTCVLYSNMTGGVCLSDSVVGNAANTSNQVCVCNITSACDSDCSCDQDCTTSNKQARSAGGCQSTDTSFSALFLIAAFLSCRAITRKFRYDTAHDFIRNF